MSYQHPINVLHRDSATFAERAADTIAMAIGSWRFLGVQACLMAAWAIVNLVGIFGLHWDPYPFLLLNILLSTQAAFTGPVLQLTSNRQAAKDRDTLEHDYETTQKVLAELDRNTALTLAVVQHLGLEVEDFLDRAPDEVRP